MFKRVLNKKKADGNKIYTLHELDVLCIAKGKEHKNMSLAVMYQLFTAKREILLVLKVLEMNMPRTPYLRLYSR